MGHIKLDSALSFYFSEGFLGSYDNFWRNINIPNRLLQNSNDLKFLEKFLLDLKITQYPWLLTTGWKHLDF